MVRGDSGCLSHAAESRNLFAIRLSGPGIILDYECKVIHLNIRDGLMDPSSQLAGPTPPVDEEETENRKRTLSLKIMRQYC